MISYFHEKIEKNAHESMGLWKVLKSLGMESGKINQSKIALEKMAILNLNLWKIQILSKNSALS